MVCFFISLRHEIELLNKVTLYKKWHGVFLQRRERDGSVILYQDDIKELLNDILDQKMINYKHNDN